MGLRMITGIVSADDYVEAYRLHRRSVASAMTWIMGGAILFGIALTIFGKSFLGVIIVFGGIGGLIGEKIHAGLYLPNRARKHYSQFKGIDTPITYRWDSGRLSVQSERGGGDRDWETIHKLNENDRLFLLCLTDVLFEIIPKAWFISQEQMSEFRRYVRKSEGV